jgi:hypothetical protein
VRSGYAGAVGERASHLFPFGIAIVLPPAGLLLGLLNVQQDQRDLGIRLIVVSILAAVVWVLLFVA